MSDNSNGTESMARRKPIRIAKAYWPIYDGGMFPNASTLEPAGLKISATLTFAPSPQRTAPMSDSTQPPAQEVPAAATPAAGAEGGDAPAGPSKSELKKRAKAEEKAKKAAAAAAKLEEERKKREAADSVDNASQNYGKQILHQSQERLGWSQFSYSC